MTSVSMDSSFCAFVDMYGQQAALNVIRCHMQLIDLKREFQELNKAIFVGHICDDFILIRLRDICGEIARREQFIRRYIQNYQ